MTKQLQIKILQRFLTEKELKSLQQQYEEAKFKSRRGRLITETDKMIWIEWRKGSLIRELAKKYKKSYGSITLSIALVAREK